MTEAHRAAVQSSERHLPRLRHHADIAVSGTLLYEEGKCKYAVHEIGKARAVGSHDGDAQLIGARHQLLLEHLALGADLAVSAGVYHRASAVLCRRLLQQVYDGLLRRAQYHQIHIGRDLCQRVICLVTEYRITTRIDQIELIQVLGKFQIVARRIPAEASLLTGSDYGYGTRLEQLAEIHTVLVLSRFCSAQISALTCPVRSCLVLLCLAWSYFVLLSLT